MNQRESRDTKQPIQTNNGTGGVAMPTVRYETINGEIIAEKRDGVRRMYAPDPLGSTVALYDNTQTKTDTFDHWPYGEVRTRTGTTPTPFQFGGTLGYYRDSDFRVYVRARHLSPARGRWITREPEGREEGALRPYCYVSDAPTNATDPSGLMPFIPGDYGFYCGFNRVGGRDNDLIPRDCIDIACKAHDECLATIWDWLCTTKRRACNAKMCWDALVCFGPGCSNTKPPHTPAGCRGEAALVADVFCSATGMEHMPGPGGLPILP